MKYSVFALAEIIAGFWIHDNWSVSDSFIEEEVTNEIGCPSDANEQIGAADLCSNDNGGRCVNAAGIPSGDTSCMKQCGNGCFCDYAGVNERGIRYNKVVLSPKEGNGENTLCFAASPLVLQTRKWDGGMEPDSEVGKDGNRTATFFNKCVLFDHEQQRWIVDDDATQCFVNPANVNTSTNQETGLFSGPFDPDIDQKSPCIAGDHYQNRGSSPSHGGAPTRGPAFCYKGEEVSFYTNFAELVTDPNPGNADTPCDIQTCVTPPGGIDPYFPCTVQFMNHCYCDYAKLHPALSFKYHSLSFGQRDDWKFCFQANPYLLDAAEERLKRTTETIGGENKTVSKVYRGCVFWNENTTRWENGAHWEDCFTPDAISVLTRDGVVTTTTTSAPYIVIDNVYKDDHHRERCRDSQEDKTCEDCGLEEIKSYEECQEAAAFMYDKVHPMARQSPIRSGERPRYCAQWQQNLGTNDGWMHYNDPLVSDGLTIYDGVNPSRPNIVSFCRVPLPEADRDPDHPERVRRRWLWVDDDYQRENVTSTSWDKCRSRHNNKTCEDCGWSSIRTWEQCEKAAKYLSEKRPYQGNHLRRTSPHPGGNRPEWCGMWADTPRGFDGYASFNDPVHWNQHGYQGPRDKEGKDERGFKVNNPDFPLLKGVTNKPQTQIHAVLLCEDTSAPDPTVADVPDHDGEVLPDNQMRWVYEDHGNQGPCKDKKEFQKEINGSTLSFCFKSTGRFPNAEFEKQEVQRGLSADEQCGASHCVLDAGQDRRLDCTVRIHDKCYCDYEGITGERSTRIDFGEVQLCFQGSPSVLASWEGEALQHKPPVTNATELAFYNQCIGFNSTERAWVPVQDRAACFTAEAITHMQAHEAPGAFSQLTYDPSDGSKGPCLENRVYTQVIDKDHEVHFCFVGFTPPVLGADFATAYVYYQCEGSLEPTSSNPGAVSLLKLDQNSTLSYQFADGVQKAGTEFIGSRRNFVPMDGDVRVVHGTYFQGLDNVCERGPGIVFSVAMVRGDVVMCDPRVRSTVVVLEKGQINPCEEKEKPVSPVGLSVVVLEIENVRRESSTTIQDVDREVMQFWIPKAPLAESIKIAPDRRVVSA